MTNTFEQIKQNIINEYYTLVGLEKPSNKTAHLSEIPVDSTTKIPEKKKKKKVTFSASTKMGGKKTRKHREKRKKGKSHKKRKS